MKRNYCHLQFRQILPLFVLVVLSGARVASPMQNLHEVMVVEQLCREEVHSAVDGQVAPLASFCVMYHLTRDGILIERAYCMVFILLVLCRHDCQHGLLSLLKLEHAV